ncbi:RagB/SusD family nutrient uptake outer membrane protein [uncultured Dokdonia sp.]|uniref:RagB/SusD family nutrient uptake outer membrane protein n=1 Tax=uncultured Dokdonia sp. TaxID=575653 RepID=UPI0026376E29|nr:RagB/SusD family nutrient uptake outer membrane protein [uncultured Dokdonia sp.]
MKTIKKLFPVIILLFAVVLYYSCDEEDLDISNPNNVAEPEFFQSEGDFRLAVNGMYHPITAVFFWGRVIHTGAMLRSDAYNVIPFQQNTTMSTLEGQPGISRWAVDMYPQLYQSISRANRIIEEDAENGVLSGDVQNEILGQAHFQRAFCNWYLLNLFGTAPLVMQTPDPQNPDEFFPTNATPAMFNEAIIADLTEAVNRLPDTWGSEDLGRPTRGAALALRGKTYLYMQDWANAAADFTTVTTLGYSLLSGANYGDNFSSDSSLENNSESIYELQYVGQDNFVWGSDTPLTGTQSNWHIDYSPPHVSLDQGHVINPHIRDIFDANGDTVRRNATMVFDYPGAEGYAGAPYLEDFAPSIETINALGVEPIFSVKYTGIESGLSSSSISGFGNDLGTNWRIIRYADVLLMLAEALNESGATGQAVGFINQVRDRAQISTLANNISQADLRQAIRDERVMELTGEGHRFFDLVRWGIADEILGQGSTVADGNHPKSLAGPAAFFTPSQDEVLWIPLSELQANPNLTQNQGY